MLYGFVTAENKNLKILQRVTQIPKYLQSKNTPYHLTHICMNYKHLNQPLKC